jgi:hypothetical protein
MPEPVLIGNVALEKRAGRGNVIVDPVVSAPILVGIAERPVHIVAGISPEAAGEPLSEDLLALGVTEGKATVVVVLRQLPGFCEVLVAGVWALLPKIVAHVVAGLGLTPTTKPSANAIEALFRLISSSASMYPAANAANGAKAPATPNSMGNS